MDTKKTILVSVLSTLATLFIVAVLVHMCHGNCGSSNSCAKATTHCSSSYGHGGGHGHGMSCGMASASCHKKKSCHMKSSCKSKSSCSKSSCSKGEKKIIKKVIKKETEE